MTQEDWKHLIKFSIIKNDGARAKGFSNTTKAFDNKYPISTTPKLFLVGKKLYEVAYYSGCFYPLWTRIYYSKKQPKYIIDKPLEP